jgi:hypothetical protein
MLVWGVNVKRYCPFSVLLIASFLSDRERRLLEILFLVVHSAPLAIIWRETLTSRMSKLPEGARRKR